MVHNTTTTTMSGGCLIYSNVRPMVGKKGIQDRWITNGITYTITTATTTIQHQTDQSKNNEDNSTSNGVPSPPTPLIGLLLWKTRTKQFITTTTTTTQENCQSSSSYVVVVVLNMLDFYLKICYYISYSTLLVTCSSQSQRWMMMIMTMYITCYL